MLASVLSAYDGLKSALGIVQGLNATNTQVQINEAKIPLQQYIIDAQSALTASNQAQAAATDDVRRLEQEIVRLKDWSAEKKRYQLKRFHPGTLAYALQPGMAAGDPPHFLCKHCYDRGEPSTLQATSRLDMRYRVHFCPSCKTEIAMGSEMPSQPSAETVADEPPTPPYDRYAELRDE